MSPMLNGHPQVHSIVGDNLCNENGFFFAPVPSYPTRCLHFLEKVTKSYDKILPQDATSSTDAKVRLDILIAGAGLGGLATAVALARSGHTVRVVEQASELGEVGAGIQIPANSSRLLLKWGLEPFLQDNVVEPDSMSFRRWETGDVIGLTRLIPDFRRSFNAPYYVVHRAHFHSALYKRALQLGVKVILNAKVKSFDSETPSLELYDGSKLTADLIIGADGVRSLARKCILGDDDFQPAPTGFAAYRATVDVHKMSQDPDTAWLLEKPALNIWIGDMRHVMTYTISGGNSFNMVLSHPDSTDPSTWNRETAINDMRNQFVGWDPRLVKIINMVEHTLKWPLLSGRPLKKWVAQSGKLLILGDAAHAMVPYMSQGAAMAVEDGAALAAVLGQVENRNEIHAALHAFEMERAVRSGQMQEASLINSKLWHFADGPEQQARDEAMLPEVLGEHFIESPNQWSDPVTQAWCYGYDAEAAMLKAWARFRRQRSSKINGAFQYSA